MNLIYKEAYVLDLLASRKLARFAVNERTSHVLPLSRSSTKYQSHISLSF